LNPDLAKLMELQKEDLEAKRLREAIAELPRRVSALANKAKATVAQRAVILDLIAKEETLRRRQESDVQDFEAKTARLRKQMDAATNTVQVTAYEHEINFTHDQVAKLEDAELESMERSEGLESQKKLADEAVAAAERKHQQESKDSVTTLAKDQQALAEVEERRKRIRAAVGEDALSTYERIARGKGTGIAEAVHQKCSACQMMLRPQRWNDLRERDNQERMTCDSCGRLLWYDPARDSPQRQTVEYESIAARIVREG
jgi:predicted  nucleic acid-binding Zn-ribbon protein